MDQKRELTELSGSVESVIYKNEENGYTVLRLRNENDETVTVVGTIPFAAPGETLLATGMWSTHSVHGRQFKAEFAQRMLPTDEAAIYQYLASGTVQGIGPATASLIVRQFGNRSLDVLENEPEKLAAIKGISLQKAKQMSKRFRQQTGVRRLMEFVCSFELRPVLAMRMYKYYGDKALDLLREDPYILAATHIGGSFYEADRLALDMGLDEQNRSRVNAAVLFELRHNLGNGHCFIPREKLCAVTSELIRVEPERVEESIEELIEARLLHFEEIAGCRACYLPELYEVEADTALRLAKMVKGAFRENVDLENIIRKLEESQGIRYAAMQRQTLSLALKNQVVVITGGPGTGKTTSIRAIRAMFERLGIRTLLTAPTGRAAKRMTELTGQEASTVHRLLGAKFEEDGEHVAFTKNEDDRLECDAVILDECSMVDILLMDALLKALPPAARLVLVGDADQLPSVGPGNVFSALIRSGVIPTVRLTEIFRQNEGSRIVRNAHMINRGEHPDFSENAGDFFRLKRMQAGSTVDTGIQYLNEATVDNKAKSEDAAERSYAVTTTAKNEKSAKEKEVNEYGQTLVKGSYDLNSAGRQVKGTEVTENDDSVTKRTLDKATYYSDGSGRKEWTSVTTDDSSSSFYLEEITETVDAKDRILSVSVKKYDRNGILVSQSEKNNTYGAYNLSAEEWDNREMIYNFKNNPELTDELEGKIRTALKEKNAAEE